MFNEVTVTLTSIHQILISSFSSPRRHLHQIRQNIFKLFRRITLTRTGRQPGDTFAQAVTQASIKTCAVSHRKWRLVYPPTGAAGGGAAPDLFQGPDTLSPLTRMISPSSPTSSFSYSSSSFSSLQTARQGLSRDPTICYVDFFL